MPPLAPIAHLLLHIIFVTINPLPPKAQAFVSLPNLRQWDPIGAQLPTTSSTSSCPHHCSFLVPDTSLLVLSYSAQCSSHVYSHDMEHG